MNDARSVSVPIDRSYDVVIPTRAGPGLLPLLQALAADTFARGRVIVVDDRMADGYHFSAIATHVLPAAFLARLTVLRSHGMGPAYARNVGWGASQAGWVVFLEDGLTIDPAWSEALARDIDAAERDADAATIAASVATVDPADVREPAGLAERAHARRLSTRALTSDAAFRRSALAHVDGFDPRFPRAHREDVDLALRLERAGFRFVTGSRRSRHAVPEAAGRWSFYALQSQHAGDAMLSAIHGRAWQEAAHTEPSSYRRLEAIAAAALDAVRAALEGRALAAAGYGLAWAFGTALDAARNLAGGPRDMRGLASAVAAAAVVPFLAVYHRLHGERAAAGLVRSRMRAVLFERDGVLVHDAPIGGDAARVSEMPEAVAALRRLRDATVRVGVLTTQPGIAAGAFTATQHDAVQQRVAEVLGPIETWAVCPHAPDAACACRPPQPELVLRAARDLGIAPELCVVVGGRGAYVEAARAAGAHSVLVRAAATAPADIARAPHVVASLERAVDLVLSGRL